MKKISTILIVLITIFNLFLLSSRWFLQPKEDTPSIIASQPSIQESLFFRALANENTPINNSDKKNYSKPTLVVRFSFLNCSECVWSALYELDKFTSTYNIKTSYGIGTFLTKRDYLVFIEQRKNSKLKIENVPENFFGLHLEKEATDPFFFVAFPDGIARHVFIPMKEDVGRTRRYLEIIRQKYFSD